MNRFSYMKAFVAVAALAIALVPYLRPSIAESQPIPAITSVPETDLRNEDRVIGKYFDDLVQYQQECFDAKKRTALRNADIDPLQRKSEDLKSRLSEVQNAIGEVVRKLKASGEWDDLDNSLLARTVDPRQRSLVQESSFKADLEDAAASLSSQKNEISLPLDNLRKRVARETGTPYSDVAVKFVAAAYGPPASMSSLSLGCRLGQIKLKLIIKLNGNIAHSPATCDAISCACKPNGGGLCTGASCPGAGATN